MTRISETFLSQAELWKYLGKSVSIPDRDAKSARVDRHGDLFEPRVILTGSSDPRGWTPESYYPPCEGHDHNRFSRRSGTPVWHGDINYTNQRTQERQKFVVGDPALTFMWSSPLIIRPGNLGRPGGGPGIWPGGLQEFLKELEELSGQHLNQPHNL